MEHAARVHSIASHSFKLGDRAHYCRRNGMHIGEGQICWVGSANAPDGKPMTAYQILMETPAYGQQVLWGFANQFRPV